MKTENEINELYKKLNIVWNTNEKLFKEKKINENEYQKLKTKIQNVETIVACLKRENALEHKLAFSYGYYYSIAGMKNEKWRNEFLKKFTIPMLVELKRIQLYLKEKKCQIM